MQFKGITIGVPREIMPGEKRVAATPFTVDKMVTAGAEVLVETGAGAGAFIRDDGYRRKGAEIVIRPEELYRRANMVIKVKELQQNTALQQREAEMIKAGSTLVGFMHPAHSVNHPGLKILAERYVTSYTLDGIPRVSKAQQIVDIAVDQGGNCALTCLGEDIEHNGVTISGIMNIPAALPIDSTKMFAQNLWHFISHIVENGQVKTDLAGEIISATLVTKNKQIVHHGTLLAMGIN